MLQNLQASRVRMVNATPPSPIDRLMTALQSSRVHAAYHKDVNVVKSSGNLVTWDDVRGSSGFGPTMLPNGGLGGTAPTVDGNGRIVTDGSASFVANASASSKFPLNTSKRTIIVIGEVLGTPTASFGLVSTIASPTTTQALGFSGGLLQLNGPPVVVAKAQPGAGVESCFMMSNNGPYDWSNADQTTEVTVRVEWLGRGPAMSVAASNNDTRTFATDPVYNVATAFLSLGRVGSVYGVVKLRAVIVMNTNPTYADRRAIEDFCVSEGVSLYTPSGSTGIVLMMGDSITAGALVTTPSFATPPNTSANSPGSYLQASANAALKPIDFVPWGLGGQNLNVMGKVQAPNTTAWTDDQLAFLSPSRRNAGLKEVVLIGFGTNDIGNQARSAAQIYTDLTTLIASIHAVGAKCIVGTVIPRGNFNGTQNTTRTSLNTLIEANTAGADAVAVHRLTDAGGSVFPFADASYPTPPSTYYNADNTHLKDAGSVVWAKTFYDAMVAGGLI